MIDVSDRLGFVEGWRIWRVSPTGQLQSLFYTADAWVPLEASSANCARPKSTHKAPFETCACGVYALRSLTQLDVWKTALSSSTHVVVGKVALWGKIIEHEHGFRSQFAYPAALLLPFQIAQGTLPGLLSYGVPLRDFDPSCLPDGADAFFAGDGSDSWDLFD